MKISDPSGRPLSGLGQPNAVVPASESGRSSQTTVQGSEADRVQISTLSAHLSAALGESARQVKKLPVLAAAVLSGRYHVDPGVVSESIIRHGLQFGGGNYI